MMELQAFEIFSLYRDDNISGIIIYITYAVVPFFHTDVNLPQVANKIRENVSRHVCAHLTSGVVIQVVLVLR
jgi:hypothetical protein